MAESPAPRRAGMFRELGGTGLNLYSGYPLNEDYQRELQGLNGVRVYTEMGNSPIVGAILFVIEQMVAQVEWKINPGTDQPADKEPAEFVKGALFDDMSYSWSDTLSEICSCFQYGWAWMEIVFKMRRGREVTGNQASSKFDDGKVGWRKWSLRGQNTLEGWEIDEGGGIKGMWQRLPTRPNDKILIPIEKSLLFRTKIDRNSPEGRPILRSAYDSWWYGKRFREIEAIGIERDLAGLPILQPPQDLDLWNENDPQAVMTLAAATKMIQSVKRGEKEGVLLPFGWTLELLGSSSRRAADVGAIINRYDTRIAQSCLADFLMLGQGKTGSWALSSDKTEMFVLALGSFLRRIKETVNRHAIPLLLELNGMDIEDPPQLEHGDIETQNLAELANYISALATVGAVAFPDPELEAHLRTAADLPPAPETDMVPPQPPREPLPKDVPPLTKREAWEKLNELREMMKAKQNGNGNGHDNGYPVPEWLRPEQRVYGYYDAVDKVFCPTGPGGGIDPTCSPPGSSGGRTAEGSGSSREPWLDPAWREQTRRTEPSADAEREELKKAFEEGNPISEKEFGGNINHVSETLLLEVEKDGKRYKGIFKPQSEDDQQFRRDIPTGADIEREVAVPAVAEVLGLGHAKIDGVEVYTPPTVKRIGNDGRWGSMVALANGSLDDAVKKGIDPSQFPPKVVAEVAAFDYVVGNTDRHRGNWRVNDDATRLALIDHNLTFPESNRPYVRSAFGVQAAHDYLDLNLLSDKWSADRWSTIEGTLRKAGLNDRAVRAAQRRWNDVVTTKKQGGSFHDLQAKYWEGFYDSNAPGEP